MIDSLDIASAAIVTKAFDFATDKLGNIAKRWANKDYMFLEDPSLISRVKSHRGTVEYWLYSEFVKNNEHLLFCEIGLELRSLEGDTNQVQDLRRILKNTHGLKGLYTAQLVQSGMLGHIIVLRAQVAQNPISLVMEVADILNRVDQYVVFVKEDTPIKKNVRALLARADTREPHVIIIASTWSAREKALKIGNAIHKNILGYTVFRFDDEQSKLWVFSRDS